MFNSSVFAEYVAQDGEHNSVVLKAPAQRIISLAPHITELLFSAGAGDKIVGTVTYSDYPPEARSIPIVGDYNRFDLEKILSLKPDLVVLWSSGNSRQGVKKLQEQGLPLFVSEPHNIESIFIEIQQLSQLTNTESFAQKNLQLYEQQYAELKTKYKSDKKLSVFYQVWDRPLMTINGRHLISQVISLCGGENIFADIPSLVPKIDIEAVLIANPKIILTSSKPGQDENWKQSWVRWRQMSAIKKNQLFEIPGDLISRHTPRILQGAKLICQHIENARQLY